jgi:hypothetical protein
MSGVDISRDSLELSPEPLVYTYFSANDCAKEHDGIRNWAIESVICPLRFLTLGRGGLVLDVDGSRYQEYGAVVTICHLLSIPSDYRKPCTVCWATGNRKTWDKGEQWPPLSYS